MIRRKHYEQKPRQQEDLQKGTGKNPEGKKGRKKDQKGRKEEIIEFLAKVYATSCIYFRIPLANQLLKVSGYYCQGPESTPNRM
jgi:hypothetical protein